MTSRPLVFASAKTFSDLFESWTYDKESAPAGEPWHFDSHYYAKRSGKPRTRKANCPIGPYCAVRGLNGHYSFYVRAKPEVYDAIKKNALPIEDDSLYFEIVVRDDGTALVCAKNNKIIGGPWVALIDASTVPTEESDEEREGVEAIIALQKFAGQTETKAQARVGWAAMTKAQKKQTMLAHAAVCGGGKVKARA